MEKSVKLSGPIGVIAVALVLLVVTVRIMSLGENSDPQLEQAVRAELWTDQSGRLGDEASRIMSEGDFSSVPDLIRGMDRNAIRIDKIATSAPLLSFSSNQRVVTRVLYRLPGESEQRERYMDFLHGPARGWDYRYDTTVVSYYLNLL